MPDSVTPTSDYNVIIIGAGFSEIYALHRLRALGFSVTLLKSAAGPGGTWFWNRYPGARCDVQSMVYSYSFDDQLEQDWKWTERDARQPEILEYIEHVIERFDLAEDMQFNTRVEQAYFDDEESRWTLVDQNGNQYRAQFCVFATGWVRQVEEVGKSTLYPLANSWYTGANIPGKPRAFMPYVGGMANYRDICDDVAEHDYRGFSLSFHNLG